MNELYHMVAMKTGALKHLAFSTTPVISKESIEQVILKNQSLTNIVHAQRDVNINTSPEAKKRLEKLVATFLKAPNLKELEIRGRNTVPDFSPAIARTCFRHRHRRVCVNVMGRSYLK